MKEEIPTLTRTPVRSALVLLGALLLATWASTSFAQDAAAPAGAAGAPDVAAELVVEGLVSPVLLTAPEGDERRFVVDQTGTVTILSPEGELADEPFLDLSDRIVDLLEGFEERGLLGLAFHPDFASNGRLYVHYSAPLREGAPGGWDHTAVVSEFRVPPGEPDRADPDSERILLQVDHPNQKTNAGAIAFGPDGYLYVAMGEGGGAHGIGEVEFGALEVPERGNVWDALAQDVDTLFGKILRLDVDRGWPGYGVPSSNPFVGREGRDEIFAWGFRNHYRMSFDREGGGELYVAAVSESLAEAVYRVDGPGNYGWPIREGTRCYDRQAPLDPPADCPDVGPMGWPIHDPVVEYFNYNVLESDLEGEPLGTAIVGGYVYRGDEIPGLDGRFVFADYSADPETPSGTVFSAGPEGDVAATWPITELLRIDARAQGMGEDADGELYVLTREAFAPAGDTGKVFRLVAGDDGGTDGGSDAADSAGEASEGTSDGATNGAADDAPDGTDDGTDDGTSEGMPGGAADDASDGASDAAADDASDATADAASEAASEAASDAGAAAEAGPAAAGGLYTEAQATRGSDAYDEHCQSCHANDLRSDGPFPPLTGTAFFRTWEGRPLGELFAYIHDYMPLGAGGSLEDETYADITAYWLSRHGYEAGDAALPPSADEIPDVPVEDRR